MTRKKSTKQAKAEFLYSGPTTTLTLSCGATVTLVNQRQYSLPAADPKVGRLQARLHLIEIVKTKETQHD